MTDTPARDDVRTFTRDELMGFATGYYLPDHGTTELGSLASHIAAYALTLVERDTTPLDLDAEQVARAERVVVDGWDTDAKKLRLAASSYDLRYPSDKNPGMQRDLFRIADRLEVIDTTPLSEDVEADFGALNPFYGLRDMRPTVPANALPMFDLCISLLHDRLATAAQEKAALVAQRDNACHLAAKYGDMLRAHGIHGTFTKEHEVLAWTARAAIEAEEGK